MQCRRPSNTNTDVWLCTFCHVADSAVVLSTPHDYSGGTFQGEYSARFTASRRAVVEQDSFCVLQGLERVLVCWWSVCAQGLPHPGDCLTQGAACVLTPQQGHRPAGGSRSPCAAPTGVPFRCNHISRDPLPPAPTGAHGWSSIRHSALLWPPSIYRD